MSTEQNGTALLRERTQRMLDAEAEARSPREQLATLRDLLKEVDEQATQFAVERNHLRDQLAALQKPGAWLPFEHAALIIEALSGQAAYLRTLSMEGGEMHRRASLMDAIRAFLEANVKREPVEAAKERRPPFEWAGSDVSRLAHGCTVNAHLGEHEGACLTVVGVEGPHLCHVRDLRVRFMEYGPLVPLEQCDPLTLREPAAEAEARGEEVGR